MGYKIIKFSLKLLIPFNFCLFGCVYREEQSEIDMISGFYVLFGSGKILALIRFEINYMFCLLVDHDYQN